MCGIAGIVAARGSAEDFRQPVLRMQAAMRHRGPDGSGLLVEADAPAAVAHTRLAILDLTDAAAQPLSSPCGRYTIVYNGEIYNFRDLRGVMEAAGERFVSTGDTEVLLRLFIREGERCLSRLRGMFAFAVWDRRERSLFLARDSHGIKPLYYATDSSGRFLFASEVRALLKSGLVSRELDASALGDYLLNGHFREPATLLKSIRQLKAGSWIKWQAGGHSRPRLYRQSTPVDATGPLSTPAKTFRSALAQSLESHLVSDVPVGLFLSGGLDSTALLALASAELGIRLHTYSIGFKEQRWNELPLAARTARHFGVAHHCRLMSHSMAEQFLAEYLDSADQPSIDGFNTWCIAQAAKQDGARVVLSGLGGDELLGGYPSFRAVPRLARAGRVAGAIGRLAAPALESRFFPPRVRRAGDFLRGPHSLSHAWRCYRGLFTRGEVSRIVRLFTDELPAFSAMPRVPRNTSELQRIAHLELAEYMRNRLLRDSDAMSMSHSLELRVPFVDGPLIAATSVIPDEERFYPGKALLARAIPEIPEWISRQPKRGFLFPWGEWFEGPWKPLLEPVVKRWKRTVALDHWSRVWALFALEEWLARHGIG